MTGYTRYAIYYAPPPGPLADFGAAWLGWDAGAGRAVPHPQIGGLPAPIAQITAAPRKYGFHGTIKAPFRLSPSSTEQALLEDVTALAARLAPVRCDGLELRRLGRFLALTPLGEAAALNDLAGQVVTGLDAHRAPLTEPERARRAGRLLPRQEANLDQWGYPFVLKDFRFHLTLTGRMDQSTCADVHSCLAPILTPLCPAPLVIDDLALFGEAPDGHFHLIQRLPLGA